MKSNKYILFFLIVLAIFVWSSRIPTQIQKIEPAVESARIFCSPLETIDERMAYIFQQQEIQSLADQLNGALKEAKLELMDEKRIVHVEKLSERNKNRNCKQ